MNRPIHPIYESNKRSESKPLRFDSNRESSTKEKPSKSEMDQHKKLKKQRNRTIVGKASKSIKGEEEKKKKKPSRKRLLTTIDETDQLNLGEIAAQNGSEQFVAQEEHTTKPRKAGKSKRGREVKNEDLLENGGKTVQLEAYQPSMDNGKTKKSSKKKRKDHTSLDVKRSTTRSDYVGEGDVFQISSGDEDTSKGMKKWITEYHGSRPGLKVLQQRIDDYITTHEAQLEEEKKEREAQAAEGGWTVVVHHRGRKKTTDTETGVTVGSVAQTAIEDKMSKKKGKEVALDFYRFQRREAQRNEVLILQSKFEQDKKRIQQLRASRKFRPY